jgi:4-aminobutyrate aminotransferase-like enzyme
VATRSPRVRHWAVLDVIEDKRLIENAKRLGEEPI